MSRVYWHSEQRTVELHGSERAWLNHVARGPAIAAWDLTPGTDLLERATALLDMTVGESYLHPLLRAAQTEYDTYHASWKGLPPGVMSPRRFDPEPERRLAAALKTALHVEDLQLDVAGVRLHTGDVELNTALVAGSDPIRLAAKIHGWCEAHAWVDGPDREWMAGIIEDGLATGIYRRTLPAPSGDTRPPHTQGWEDVLGLLRESADGPVVMSYSVCDDFPNLGIADWAPPRLPDDWRPAWADSAEGLAEWDAYDDAEKAESRADAAESAWYDLSEERKWALAMDGLRSSHPWARIAPDTLAGVTFGPSVSVYDLFAPDRDDRVRAAAGMEHADA